MKLKDRLSRLQSQAGAAAPAPADKPSLSSLRQRIAQLESRGRARSDPAGTAPWPRAFDEIHRGQGPFAPATGAPALALADRVEGDVIAEGVIRIRRHLALDHVPGAVALNSLPEQPRLPGETASHHRNVYIDTETTGLSGGSGTLAFLVGIAVIEADAIELNQFLITGFSAEAAALSAFAECLGPDDRLVSYNGKSYDLPLLMTRFRMQALRHPFDGLPHLDLLHPVRRLFGRRWPDCRLMTVERELLGLRRVDDLPGSEAPEAWFSYVRHGHTANLIRVVDHNRQDIVSLAVAHGVLARAVEQPRSFGVDLHALARWLAEYDEDRARDLLQSCADRLCDDGYRFLGHLLRRAGQWQQATAIWESLAARGCLDSMERLAKYHEHVSKDLAAARRCSALLPGGAEHEHRRRRIAHKIAVGKVAPP